MSTEVVIIGAGAAGLMAAITSAQRGLATILIEHGNKIGSKILISGGGRCNFTNLEAEPHAYLSHNRHFAKSAMARYTQWDFLDLMTKNDLSWNEKKLGQLFCDQGAKAVVAMLTNEAKQAGVDIRLETSVSALHKTGDAFQVTTDKQSITARAVMIATGGLSIPKMGATGFAYDIAKQFDLTVTDLRPALVPFTFQNQELSFMKALAGVSVDAEVKCGAGTFRENLLFTHRGLSGPSILQISSYWREGDEVTLNLLPTIDLLAALVEARKDTPKQSLSKLLKEMLPNRYVDALLSGEAGVDAFQDQHIAQISKSECQRLSDHLQRWIIVPQGTEGYRTAEVTLGGINTDDLSSKTMEAKDVPGLYFIGECVDVTGWLGGYNFQWAWASGFAAGTAVCA